MREPPDRLFLPVERGPDAMNEPDRLEAALHLQGLRLVRAFLRISDASARDHVIRLAEAYADHRGDDRASVETMRVSEQATEQFP